MRTSLASSASQPSIHHHFPSKVDLVRTLVSRYREEAEAGIANLERHVPDPLDQLRAYTGYWQACIADASAPFCVCALLAGELPVLPEEVGLEVRAHFRSLSAWLTSVLERGARQGRLQLTSTPRVEAELLMATVHGAMLSARAYGSEDVRRHRHAASAIDFPSRLVVQPEPHAAMQI